jgi:hypothetical protein
VKGGGGDDMPIQSPTGKFNIFFYSFEDILYDHMQVNIQRHIAPENL